MINERPKNFRVLFVYPNTMMVTLLPVGIPILDSCLKKAGFQTKLFDTTLYKTEEISSDMKKVELLQVRKFNYESVGVKLKTTNMFEDFNSVIDEYKPNLISFSIVQDTLQISKDLIQNMRNKEIPIIAGGVFPTLCPDDILSIEGINFVCIGEGEEPLVELANNLYEQKDVTTIENLYIKTELEIVKNKIRPPVVLEDLPDINFDLFDKERIFRPMQGKMHAMVHIEIDRGCPYLCTYCASPRLKELYKEKTGKSYYRQKSVSKIINELKYLVRKYNPSYVYFNSETFLARPIVDIRQFAKKYKEEIGLPFWCQTRPETISEEKMFLLKDMGVANINIGIECGNEDFRRTVLKRYYSNEQMIDAFKILDSFGLQYTLNNIIGFPGETREIVFDTININRTANPTTVNVYIFAAYKNSPLYNYCLNEGFLDKDAVVNQLMDGTELKNQPLSYQELKGLQRTFPLYAFFPESKFEIIRRAESFDQEGNALFEKLKTDFYRQVFKTNYE